MLATYPVSLEVSYLVISMLAIYFKWVGWSES